MRAGSHSAEGCALGVAPDGGPFGYPRDFLGNRFVYAVISPRAKGLSIGVNCNPDKACNLDCIYCEVNRKQESHAVLDVKVMAAELLQTVQRACAGEIGLLPRYAGVPAELLELRHVALSGDGEPTLSSRFAEIVQGVVHIRALGRLPFFKIVLVTNAAGFDRPAVQYGLKFLTRADEIWVKLDAGTEDFFRAVTRSQCSLRDVTKNILLIARQRPVVIQSLFPAFKNQELPAEEVEAYALRLKEMKEQGAMISLVQIYSATRPAPRSEYGHLPLRSLARIAQRVREVANLKAEVF